MRSSCARTRKTKTSLNSFVRFHQSKLRNKQNLSSIFAEVSESFGIFEIAWVFAEIFGFENLKFSISNPKSKKLQRAGSCTSEDQKRKTKKTLSGIFAELSESFGIFEIAWVVAEIFGFEKSHFFRKKMWFYI